jgi:riboflavin transporter FmnP
MKNKTITRLTTTAMLTAVAVILGYFAFPIFLNVAFLEYDACDVMVLITSFSFGPLYGVMSSVAVAIFQAFLLDKSGIFGFLMNIVSTTALTLPAAIIYLKHKTKKGAATALAVGSAVTLVVMVAFNYLVTPHFMGAPIAVVHSLMPFIAGFNAIKAVINSIITFFVYKHIGKIIKKFN